MKTIRAQFVDRRSSRAPRALLFFELLFLIAGLAAIDYYIWVDARATISQAYDHWVFTEELQGRKASIEGFLRAEIDRLRGRSSGEEKQPPAVVQRPTPRLPSAPEPQSVIGRLEIPRLQMNLMVREGVSEQTLREAVGHVPSTALPGRKGNVALAAHRDTFFRPLRNIRKGDVITLQTLAGTYQYAVRSVEIVRPSDTQVLNAANHPELTLVTCYPFYYVGSAPKRFIVHATQLAAVRPNASSVRAD
jgi:sortase A